MSYGPVQVFSISMTCGATLSSYVDLQKAYNKITVMVPSMTSTTDIYFQASDEAGGTYRRLFHPPNSVSSTAGALFLSSSITNCVVPLNHVNVRYLKIEHSSAMTAAAASYKIICSD
jgi:hypothetical protein